MPFNQWAEGAATESAAQWSSPSGHGFDLDTLHSDGVPMNKIVVSAGDIACAQGTVPEPPPGGVVRCHQVEVSDIFVETLPGGGFGPRTGLTAVLSLGDNQYDVRCPVGVRGPVPQQLGPGARPHQAEHRQPRVQGFCKEPSSAEASRRRVTSNTSARARASSRTAGTGIHLGPDWHFIVGNSDCKPLANPAEKPCTTEDRDAWLAGHLASLGSDVDKKCMNGYWHHPRFSSYRTLAGVFSPDNWQLGMWQQLYDSPINADVILNGHGHFYERFGPLNPTGQGTTSPAESARSRSARGVSQCRPSSRCKVPGGAFESTGL